MVLVFFFVISLGYLKIENKFWTQKKEAASQSKQANSLGVFRIRLVCALYQIR
jgi:hypothetical protein